MIFLEISVKDMIVKYTNLSEFLPLTCAQSHEITYLKPYVTREYAGLLGECSCGLTSSVYTPRTALINEKHRKRILSLIGE